MGQYSYYYPQGNGLAKSTNKTLWESRINPKESTGQSPYLLVYGNKSVLPINLEINALTVVHES